MALLIPFHIPKPAELTINKIGWKEDGSEVNIPEEAQLSPPFQAEQVSVYRVVLKQLGLDGKKVMRQCLYYKYSLHDSLTGQLQQGKIKGGEVMHPPMEYFKNIIFSL